MTPSGPEETVDEVVHDASGEAVRFVKRGGRPEYPLKSFTSTDLRGLALFPLYAAMRPLPPAMQARLGARLPVARLRTRSRFFRMGLEAYNGARPREEADRIVAACKAGHTRRMMVFVFERSPGKWHPRLSLKGREHLDAALARGRGAIIWADSFLFQTHVGKRILHEAGIPAVQLSVAEHGYSRSRFGLRWINPWNVRVENRYLAGRLVVRDGATGDIKARIGEILAANGVVIITNNAFLGYRFVAFALGDNASLRLAEGPMRLAREAGAALLPMVTVETQPLAAYAGEIGAELLPRNKAAGGEDARRRDFAATALAYRAWLTRHLDAHPGQWMSWPRLSGNPEAAGLSTDA